MNLRYLIGAVLSVPLLPFLYFQGERLKKSIPYLPEATGPKGSVGSEGNGPVLKVLAIGESTIAGVGIDTHESGFAGTFARELHRHSGRPIDWKVYAKSGYPVRRLIEEVLPTITEDQADLIVIGIGANDAFMLSNPWRWRRDVAELIDLLHRRLPLAHLYFCQMPPIKEFPAFPRLMKLTIGNLVEVLGEELVDLAKGYPYVTCFSDIITLSAWTGRLNGSTSSADLFSDGMHPSALTYRVWAEDVAERVWAEEVMRCTS